MEFSNAADSLTISKEQIAWPGLGASKHNSVHPLTGKPNCAPQQTPTPEAKTRCRPQSSRSANRLARHDQTTVFRQRNYHHARSELASWSLNSEIAKKQNRPPTTSSWGRYHGSRRPSSGHSFHSPTVIPPSALDKPSHMKRYHRRRKCSHTSPRCSPTMVMLHGTLSSADNGMTVGL